ncbi:MAG: ATPase domain-containing protein [Candidatus Aminicenantes bacterium]
MIAEEPSKVGIFDKELARMVAIVVTSHLKNFREHLNIDSILGDEYLARHGKIRLSWLCALLAIGDDLDTSYHRAIPDYFSDYHLPEESSKGKFRRCIGGCKIDLTGRCIVIFPLKELEEAIYNCSSGEDIYKFFSKDISEKNNLLKSWRHELKQMDIEIESCLVEVNGHLLKVIDDKNNRSNVNTGNVSKFILTVEPTITYFKINRVLDGMFNLRYGVFNKKYFSWEMLQSEAGFENQDELKLIVHRIARLAAIYSDIEGSELLFFKRESTNLPYTIEVEELDGEWKIDVLSRDPQQQDSSTNHNDSILEIGSRLLFFIKSIIEVKPGLDDYRNTIKLALTKIELPSPSDTTPLEVLFKNGKFNITRFFIRPGNQNLTYLLEEINLCPKLYPLGIELPKLSSMYIDTDKENNIRYFPKILEMSSIRSREYLNFFEDNNKRRILLLPRLSPRFVGEITEKSERILFWQRFKQISRLLESSYSITKGDPFHPNRLHAVVIDNLNCFLNEPMAREYIFKLFRLMSLSGVLGIFILEDFKEETVDSIKVLEEVRFLTDIWIELGWKYKLDYKYKTIEIKKSRYQRHVVGSHPFKIRLEENVQ